MQKNTYTVLLKSLAKPPDISDKKYDAAARDMQELEDDLGAAGDYFNVVR